METKKKQRVFKGVKSEMKKKDIAEEFGMPVGTLSTIIKFSNEIDLNFSTNQKRKGDPEFTDI